jgi:pimeloyl-ACP methyl ester carboxylesterase
MVMRCTLLVLTSLAVGCAGTTTEAPSPATADDHGAGPQLWMQVAGHGDPTVVFEAGGGDDSSVWAGIEPQVRLRCGVRTVVYDRAGLGKSGPTAGPYHIDDEATALTHALDRFGVRGPIVLVAHSYGGFIATLVAASDPRVIGAVFVDANVVEFFDDAEVAHLVGTYTPQLDELRRTNPALAQVMAPIIAAYPETVRRMRAVPLPPNLPVIDIVAENSWGDSDEERAAMKRAHAAFVAASPARAALQATGSSHYVMRDQPALVIDAIARLLLFLHHT